MKFYNNQPRVEKVIAIFQNILIFWRVLVYSVMQRFQVQWQRRHPPTVCRRYGTSSRKYDSIDHFAAHYHDSGGVLEYANICKKTKIVIIGKDIPEDESDIIISGNVLERVDNFIYLGQLFTTNGKAKKK